jgi:uncharacterized protein (DUF488 family)
VKVNSRKDQVDYRITIWTVGHSTRSGEEFTALLTAHQVELVADVRAFASSRRYPQFNKENLAGALKELGVGYRHMPELGGRRQPSKSSRNIAWKNASFRGYADYMETENFREGVGSLLAGAREKRTAIMCAEALWWRCHRSLIADYLKVRGSLVLHIVSATAAEEHPYTSAARVLEGELSYAALLHETDLKVGS